MEELSRDKDAEDWQLIIQQITINATADPGYDPGKWENIISNIINTKHEPQVHEIKSRKNWIPYAAAAVLLIIAGTYFWMTQVKEKPSVTQTNPVPVQNDVAPGGNRATLTLADGSKIILDSAKSGELAREENATITKTVDGRIIYDPNEKLGNRIIYNRMATPRGGQYQLTLPDGSEVWLNAESSITYPTAFAGKERKVIVTGEAYFEVTTDMKKPFLVEYSAGGNPEGPSPAAQDKLRDEGSPLTIEVLGTHFNVNTYKEEPTKNITLLEGSVRIKTVHTSLILKPGQQGQWDPRKENLSLAVNPSIEQAVAWKNGVFDFNGQDFAACMRQLERWYDIKVVYDGSVPSGTFLGQVDRKLNLSDAIELLSGVVAKFRLEGRQLHVIK